MKRGKKAGKWRWHRVEASFCFWFPRKKCVARAHAGGIRPHRMQMRLHQDACKFAPRRQGLRTGDGRRRAWGGGSTATHPAHPVDRKEGPFLAHCMQMSCPNDEHIRPSGRGAHIHHWAPKRIHSDSKCSRSSTT